MFAFASCTVRAVIPAGILLGVIVCSYAGTEELPHISTCNFCQTCYVKAADRPESSVSSRRALDALQAPSKRVFLEVDGAFAPTPEEIEAKSRKLNCTECYGCSTYIQPLSGGKTAFGVNWKVDKGASPEWLFYADLPDTKRTAQRAIVKVWCMPIDKVRGTWRWKCQDEQEPLAATQFLLAQQRVIQECGLSDVTVKVWVAPVNAVVPNIGFHIWWSGLWMEVAEGISVNRLAFVNKKLLSQQNVLTLLQEKLNKTLIVRAAMYDLLTSQCDRHSQNVFVQENGNFKLIDNMQALHYSWTTCGINSVFLPTTQMNEIVRVGGDVVSKRLKSKLKTTVNPMVLLDYRCYVEGGAIGINYPPKLKQCLIKLSNMTPQDIKDLYKFPKLVNAEVLFNRATDMITRGFEWTIKYGKPTNRAPKRYLFQPPCCKLLLDDQQQIHCAHPWNVSTDMPLGDPVAGGEWKKPYADPGVFVGGTRF